MMSILLLSRIHPPLSYQLVTITFQEPEKFRERRRTREETRKTQPAERIEESDDFIELLKCFQRNSAGSACPNTAKGIFVNYEQTRRFLNPRSEEI